MENEILNYSKKIILLHIVFSIIAYFFLPSKIDFLSNESSLTIHKSLFLIILIIINSSILFSSNFSNNNLTDIPEKIKKRNIELGINNEKYKHILIKSFVLSMASILSIGPLFLTLNYINFSPNTMTAIAISSIILIFTSILLLYFYFFKKLSKFLYLNS